MLTVDVIIPTYKPDKELAELIRKLKSQTKKPEHILIINTEQRFLKECEELDSPDIQIFHIKKAEFDHGATRDFGVSKSNADFVLFLTQDAMPANNRLIEHLLAAFRTEKTGAAYARQLPKPGCGEIERFTRSFNYPEQSLWKSNKDLEKYGIKTYFCSNVCACYKRSLYLELGGFEKKTIFNEDMIFCGKLVQAGYEIGYCAGAQVYHSHNYSCMQQFHRNFDLAVSQADHPEIFKGLKSESEGMKLVKRTAKHCLNIGKPWLLFELVLKSGYKFIGYRMGKNYRKLPSWLIKACTMNPSYWENQIKS